MVYVPGLRKIRLIKFYCYTIEKHSAQVHVCFIITVSFLLFISFVHWNKPSNCVRVVRIKLNIYFYRYHSNGIGRVYELLLCWVWNKNIMQKSAIFLSTIPITLWSFRSCASHCFGKFVNNFISFLFFSFFFFFGKCARSPNSEIQSLKTGYSGKVACHALTDNAVVWQKHSHRSGLSFRKKKSIDKRVM